MEKIKTFILRILATFVATALGVIGAGAIAGVDVFKACIIAGIAGVASVIEKIARTYMEDGQLSDADIDEAFGEVANQETTPVAEQAAETVEEPTEEATEATE
jgi:hypothetical protein